MYFTLIDRYVDYKKSVSILSFFHSQSDAFLSKKSEAVMLVNLDKLQTAVWIYDIDNFCIIWANQAALKFWGSPSIEELRQRDLNVGASSAIQQALLNYQTGFKLGKVFQENWTFTPNDKEVKAFCNYSGIELDNGRIGMLVEASTVNNFYSHTYFNESVLISMFTQSGDFLSSSLSFGKEFGDQIGSLSQLFCHDSDLIYLLDVLKNEGKYEGDILLRSKSGNQWYHLQVSLSTNNEGNTSILIYKHNIDSRKKFEISLAKQALTDPLTQLTNRRGLYLSIQKLIAQAEDKFEAFSLLYIDIDSFKAVNDAYGHDVGDKLLVEVAQRINNELDEKCELARFGGDEFVLLIHDTCFADRLKDICERILQALSRPFNATSIKSLSASIGSACFPQDAHDVDELINCADSAMYHAKRLGKKQYVKYQDGMHQELKRVSDISMKLANAIETHSLCLYYQPIIDVTNNNKIISFEALLRWFDDDLGYINPEEAVTIAEKKGLIEALEIWVLNQALADLTLFQQMFHSQMTMSVNMSGLHLSRFGAAEKVCQIIKDHRHQPSSLLIELTENVLIDNIDNSDCEVQKLIKEGVKVSLDDFGTGYTSLAYLHHLPASILKVDKLFTQHIDKHRVTLECISKVSNAFNMTGLVEGVETEHQADELAAMGFQLQQGYWFGKPQPFKYYIDKM